MGTTRLPGDLGMRKKHKHRLASLWSHAMVLCTFILLCILISKILVVAFFLAAPRLLVRLLASSSSPSSLLAPTSSGGFSLLPNIVLSCWMEDLSPELRPIRKLTMEMVTVVGGLVIGILF